MPLHDIDSETYLTEIICGGMFLAAGVPAARGTHALVELQGRKRGLYVLKEGFDRTFLKRHFKNTSGNLYDGGFLADIDRPVRKSSGSGTSEVRVVTLIMLLPAKTPLQNVPASSFCSVTWMPTRARSACSTCPSKGQ